MAKRYSVAQAAEIIANFAAGEDDDDGDDEDEEDDDNVHMTMYILLFQR